MRRVLGVVCSVMLALGVVGLGHAVPYTDTHDGGQTKMSGLLWRDGFCGIASWTFDITDDGFDLETEDIISAKVILNLKDDDGDRSLFGLEAATLGVGENLFFWEVDTGEKTLMLGALMVLSDTGTIDCALASFRGDYSIHSAELFAESDSSQMPTPEPGTMLLLGSGLLGLAAFSRGLDKQKANKRRMNT